MADRVLWQNNDSLSPSNLQETRAQSNSTDYVERGLDITADFPNDEIDIGAGHAVIMYSNRAIDVFPAARTNKALADAGGMNYVYVVADPDVQDDVSITIKSSQSAPSNPSLLIGTVDAGGQSVTELARAPSGTYESVEADNLSFRELQAWPLENGSDMTGSRSFDTTYQNTNPYTIQVIVQVQVNPSSGTAAINSALAVSEFSASIGSGPARSDGAVLEGRTDRTKVYFTALVPPGYYYALETFGDESIDRWNERGLTA